MAAVLEATDLVIRFITGEGEVKAVNGASFSLEEDSILGLVGESGAGKSTIALAVLKLLPSTARVESGSATFGGLDLMQAGDDELRRIRGKDIVFIPQDPRAALNPVMRVGNQVEEEILAHTEMSKREATDLSLQTLREMGLPEPREVVYRYPHELSGGMCQRVVLAMGLALKPRVIIADEPTSSLDVTIQAEILRYLKSYCKDQGSSMVLITHDLGVVAQMADQVAVMYAGDIVERTDVVGLFHSPRHPYVGALLGSLPRMDREERRFAPIGGNPPDMLNLPAQCPFLPRCPKAINECRTEPKPDLVEMDPAHWVACYNPHERASIAGVP